MDIRVPAAKESAGGVSIHYDRDRKSNVSITVGGPTAKWATEVFAEVAEQVERTFSTNWIHRYLLGQPHAGIDVLTMVAVTMSMVMVIFTVFNRSVVTRQHEPSSLLQCALAAKTSEEKLQVIFDKTVNDLADAVRQQQANPIVDLAVLLSWRALFMALPVLVVAGAVVYLASVCYPWGVFAWGDWEQEYSEIVSRRKSIWTVVVVAVLVGIISNLFVLNLPGMK